jgi:hypothetical protein
MCPSRDTPASAPRYPARDFAGFEVGPIDAVNISHRLPSYEEDKMSAAAFTFQIFGRSCVVVLPPSLDGVPPANDVHDAAQRAHGAHANAQPSRCFRPSPGGRTQSGFQRVDAVHDLADTVEADDSGNRRTGH